MPSRTTPTANGFSERVALICRGLRRALSAYLDESIERQRRESDEDPEQTTAFRRVLQTAILHVQSAQRSEATVGDILAAILQQPKSYAAQLLADQGVTRLDVLNYISHGISKVPVASADAALPSTEGATRRSGPGHGCGSTACLLRESHRTRAAGQARSDDWPHARAPAHDRSALPASQEQSRVRRRAWRR